MGFCKSCCVGESVRRSCLDNDYGNALMAVRMNLLPLLKTPAPEFDAQTLTLLEILCYFAEAKISQSLIVRGSNSWAINRLADIGRLMGGHPAR